MSHRIRKVSKLRNVPASRSENTAVPLKLCSSCWSFLKKDESRSEEREEEEEEEGGEEEIDDDDINEDNGVVMMNEGVESSEKDPFKHTVYAFLWDILSGGHKGGDFYSYKFHDIYGEMLWQLIPSSMRPWWIDAVKEINTHGDYPFRNCSLEYPVSVFVDKTEDCIQFEKEIDESLVSMAKALDRDEIMDPNILCPHGCGVSCRRAKPIEWCLVLQCILKKVVLNLPTKTLKKYRHYMHGWDAYFRRDNDYARLLSNENWLVKPGIILTKGGVWKALSCSHHDHRTNDMLRLYPPRNPNPFNVNARDADKISPVQMNPRVTRYAKTSRFSSTSRMVEQQFSYEGVDSFFLTQGPRNGHITSLQSIHNAAIFAGRSDIRLYITNCQERGEFPEDFFVKLDEYSRQLFPDGVDSLSQYTQGSTYVPYLIAIKHWLGLQKPNTVKYQRTLEGIPIDEKIQRGWPRFCGGVVQKEDSNGWGYQFRPVPQFSCGFNPLPLWMIFSLLVSSTELYSLIDTETVFTRESWQGLVMTNIGSHCLKNEIITLSKKYPFKKLSATTLANQFATHCGITRESSVESVIGSEFFGGLFSSYGSTIKIFDSPPDEESILHESGQLQDTRFLLFVTNGVAVINDINADGKCFEHRVLICVTPKNGNKFDGYRMMRYGLKFPSYWRQHRKDSVVSQYPLGNDLRINPGDDDIFYISLFVRKEDKESLSAYRVDLLKSLGGQGHVQCRCCDFPLIPSPRPKKRKRRCNAWTGEGDYQPCSRKESFVCSNASCDVRCCRVCFKQKPDDIITYLVPHDNDEAADANQMQVDDVAGDNGVNRLLNDDDDDEEEDDDGGGGGEDIGSGGGYHEDEDDEEGVLDEINESSDNDALIRGVDGTDMDMIMNEELYEFTTCPQHLIRVDQDYNFETSDDINIGSVPTTDAGNYLAPINQRPNAGTVNGRVLMNQIGSVLMRRNKNITGTQAEQHFVQSLAASSGGTSASILYPDGQIFTRHYYCNASEDGLSTLGVMPISCLRRHRTLGIVGFDDQYRTLMKSPDSTISTDPNHTGYVYDALTNAALNTTDSRILVARGLEADGFLLSPREEDNNDDIFDNRLTGDTDSHKNVRYLCASMKYIQWSHFYTLTLSHKTHPGIWKKFLWKQEQEWLRDHPDFPHISDPDRRDFIDGFEDAYTHLITPRWLEVADIVLHCIKDQLTHIGATTAIFARHEYQDSAGKFLKCLCLYCFISSDCLSNESYF
jgi:hypothetical protein